MTDENPKRLGMRGLDLGAKPRAIGLTRHDTVPDGQRAGHLEIPDDVVALESGRILVAPDEDPGQDPLSFLESEGYVMRADRWWVFAHGEDAPDDCVNAPLQWVMHEPATHGVYHGGLFGPACVVCRFDLSFVTLAFEDPEDLPGVPTVRLSVR